MNKKYNAADEQIVADKEKARINERIQELKDIEELMNTPQGVRFFRRLFSIGGIYTTSFTGNSATFFKEGGRNLALIFFHDVVEACPQKLADTITKEEIKNG